MSSHAGGGVLDSIAIGPLEVIRRLRTSGAEVQPARMTTRKAILLIELGGVTQDVLALFFAHVIQDGL